MDGDLLSRLRDEFQPVRDVILQSDFLSTSMRPNETSWWAVMTQFHHVRCTHIGLRNVNGLRERKNHSLLNLLTQLSSFRLTIMSANALISESIMKATCVHGSANERKKEILNELYRLDTARHGSVCVRRDYHHSCRRKDLWSGKVSAVGGDDGAKTKHKLKR